MSGPSGQGGVRAPGTPPTSTHQPSLHSDSSLLQDNVAFVLCLDTLGRGDSLHLHVSKPPREGTLQHSFLRELETVGAPPEARLGHGSFAHPGASGEPQVGFLGGGRWASPWIPEAGGSGRDLGRPEGPPPQRQAGLGRGPRAPGRA